MRGFITIIFLFSMVALMFASQTMYHSYSEQNITFDIYNFTENTLVWNYTTSEESINNNFTTLETKRISKIIYKFVDFFGYSLFEISKWAMEFGYTHPEYNFGYLMNFIKYWLFAMIAISILPILVPLLALIYLVLVGLNKLFFRKKKLNEVKQWKTHNNHKKNLIG